MESFETYPLIHLLFVQVDGLPPDQRFIYQDPHRFVSSTNNTSKLEKVPPEVEHFFDEQKSEKVCYHGWNWIKEEGGGLLYYRCSLPNQRDQIEANIQPYLNTLQDLVGQEITPLVLLPPPSFKREGEEAVFSIPDTKFYLMFSDLGQNNDKSLELEIIVAGLSSKRDSDSGLVELATVAAVRYKVKEQ